VDPAVFNADGTSVLVGKTVIAYQAGLGSEDRKLTGPYIVDDPGARYINYGTPQEQWVESHAVLRRHPDYNDGADFVPGLAFRAQNGTTFGGKWIKLTTTGTIVLGAVELDWAVESSNPNPATYHLLTASQVLDADSDTVEASSTLDSADGQQTLLMVDGVSARFETLVGTPGIATIPAGKFTADLLAKVSTAATGSTTLTVQLWKDISGTYTKLLECSTSAITSPDYVIKQISQVIAEQDVAGARLQLRILAQTTSATDVTVSVVVNNATRSTRISLPVDFAVGSNEDHRQTTHRDAENQHPWGSMEPAGTATFPMPSLTIAAGGKLILDAGNFFLVDPSTNDLRMISTPSVSAGQTVPITLVFTGAVKLQHQQTPDAGFSDLYLHRDGSVNNPLAFKHPFSAASFVYAAGTWVMTSFHSTQ